MIPRKSRPFRRLLAALAALSAFGSAATIAAQDWNLTVTRTEAGHRMGNPDAPLSLIAFLSYTCPSCGQFAKAADGALALGYVGPGRVTLENRPMVRDPVDLTVAMLVDCVGPKRHAAAHATFMERQSGWLSRATAVPQAQRALWSDAGQSAERRRSIASTLELYPMVERFDIDRIKADRCLADQKKADALLAAADGNRAQFGVRGTPSFAIDGVLLEGVHSWAALQPLIDARLRPES